MNRFDAWQVRIHAGLTVFFLVLTPVSFWLGWLDAVAFVSLLSIYALVATHWGAWMARPRPESKRGAGAGNRRPALARLTPHSPALRGGPVPRHLAGAVASG